MKRISLIAVVLILFNTTIFANSFNVGDKIPTFSLTNQFDKKTTINKDIKYLIISFEKSTGKEINSYLSKKPASYLKKNSAVFIANISKMPIIITKMFALPKMRDYTHNILLILDENDKRFVSKEGKSTLYTLDNLTIKSIEFITSKKLKRVFSENR